MSINILLLSAFIAVLITIIILNRVLLIGSLLTYINSLHYWHKKRNFRPRRIILVRHGESEGNLSEDIYRSTPDAHISLTQLGKDQAIEAGRKLKKEVLINDDSNENIYVYLSPYLRSRQTYEGISKAFSPSQIIKVREDPRLREQEWGNFLHPDIRRTEMEERKKVGDFYFRFSNGESGADVYDRCTLFLDTLFRENMNGQIPKSDNILIVSHGLFMRLFLMRYFRWTVDEHHQWRNFKNCEYCVLEHDINTGSYELKTKLEKKKSEQEE
ncbi:hypothetical protein I4U23_022904 [Adineta vaga]|nr:hypothetical protein I4U23_022904 [Adineta vaga]